MITVPMTLAALSGMPKARVTALKGLNPMPSPSAPQDRWRTAGVFEPVRQP
jgi:hypothetical protein